MLPWISFLLLVLIVVFLFMHFTKKPSTQLKIDEGAIKVVLEENVLFYQELKSEEKIEFEQRVFHFLKTVVITGVNVSVEEMDKAFIAAGAVIPIFRFENWQYANLNEVLLYPDAFSEGYKQEGNDRHILGMVGTGAMHRTMILSQHALRNGFLNEADARNTAIHEFVHLIDKTDGETDGLPEAILHHQYSLPWLHLMHEEILDIRKNKSDIDPYGTTNEAEFFAVAAEYFFEQPEKMEEKHPEVFEYLEKMFLR